MWWLSFLFLVNFPKFKVSHFLLVDTHSLTMDGRKVLVLQSESIGDDAYTGRPTWLVLDNLEWKYKGQLASHGVVFPIYIATFATNKYVHRSELPFSSIHPSIRRSTIMTTSSTTMRISLHLHPIHHQRSSSQVIISPFLSCHSMPHHTFTFISWLPCPTWPELLNKEEEDTREREKVNFHLSPLTHLHAYARLNNKSHFDGAYNDEKNRLRI